MDINQDPPPFSFAFRVYPPAYGDEYFFFKKILESEYRPWKISNSGRSIYLENIPNITALESYIDSLNGFVNNFMSSTNNEISQTAFLCGVILNSTRRLDGEFYYQEENFISRYHVVVTGDKINLSVASPSECLGLCLGMQARILLNCESSVDIESLPISSQLETLMMDWEDNGSIGPEDGFTKRELNSLYSSLRKERKVIVKQLKKELPHWEIVCLDDH